MLVSDSPRPTLPAAMAAWTMSGLPVKSSTRIGRVLNATSANRSFGRLATKADSSSRATLPFGSRRRPGDWLK
jgi:hypothetical protein